MIDDKQEALIAKARVLAEEFAKSRTPKFLKAFLEDASIAKEFRRLEQSDIKDERYLELLVDEYKIPFGHALALAYCIGFMDSAQGAPTNLYREKSKAPLSEAPTELVKPGEF